MSNLQIIPEPELLTVAEAAQKLRVGETTVRAICNAGRLPHVRIGERPGRGAYRIFLTDLRAFMQQGREVAS